MLDVSPRLMCSLVSIIMTLRSAARRGNTKQLRYHLIAIVFSILGHIFVIYSYYIIPGQNMYLYFFPILLFFQ